MHLFGLSVEKGINVRVGIITFTEGYNYGNKLQNYALLTFLSNHIGQDVCTICNKVHHGSYLNNFITNIKRMIPSKKHFAYMKRQARFNNFNKAYLNITKRPLTSNTKSFKDIDCFVCGSDQIWNPNYYKNIDPLVGKFKDNKPSISYAASFGVSEIPESLRKSYAESISSLKAISVREQQGKIICANLGIEGVEVNVDPTMLLSKSEWELLIKEPYIKPKNKYVLTYYLGNIPIDVEHCIQKYCINNDCERIDLNSTDSLDYFVLNPQEFLYMIYNSEIVFTDSFHASVFSIIFKKKFLVSSRVIAEKEKMNSRIESLLDLFELQHHKFEGFSGDFAQLLIDEESIDSVLEAERSHSALYFRNNLQLI